MSLLAGTLIGLGCGPPPRPVLQAPAPVATRSTAAARYDRDFEARSAVALRRASRPGSPQESPTNGSDVPAREDLGEGRSAGWLAMTTTVEPESESEDDPDGLRAELPTSEPEADIWDPEPAYEIAPPGEDMPGAPAAGGASVVEVEPGRGRPSQGRVGPGESSLITNVAGAIHVPAGRSMQLVLSEAAERVAIADPDVAEVVVISPYEVLINGRGRKETLQNGHTSVGEAQTSIIIWSRSGRSDKRTLYVNRSRNEQILLEVTVAEINRSALERYGVDFNLFQDGNLVFSTPAKIVSPGDTLTDVLPGADRFLGELPLRADRLTALYRNFNEDFTIFLEALQQERLAKVLARPVLLARSGEEAHLRVGGEIPIVYATANVATIEFKEFGTLLTFTPEFTDDGLIDLRAAMEVSEPTPAFSTAFAGFEVPSFVGRRAETRVGLEEGQSLLIGGLYRETVNETEEKVPYLGDIPLLGFAFRKTVHDTVRTETVMTVRPTVARDPAQLVVRRLPTDRGPLTRGEVRTQPNPYGVSRPRIGRGPTSPPPVDRRTPDDYTR